MPRYTKESLERLRQKIDLVELLEQHLSLKRSGTSYKALCPFHDEKSPSFIVQKGDWHYHCFGCGAHGDAIQFLMEHLKLSFSDAVQHLADRFQVELEVTTQDTKKENRAGIKEANDCAWQFYHHVLLRTEEGREPLEYLFKRGIGIDFITSFGIGLAPRDGYVFYRFAREKGFDEQLLLDAGLIVQRGGKIYDFFSERIMFPIHDAAGAVIGFSGRKYRETTFGGKYINTPETALFKKSHVLFGFHHSRKRIIKEKQTIIVEGQIDALQLIYNGFNCTVAALGTAFGEGHVHELVRAGVNRVFLLFDADNAGFSAAVKVGHLFQKEGIAVLVGRLPVGQDPDTTCQQHGPLGIVDILLQAEEYLQFLFKQLSQGVRIDSPAEKDQLLAVIVQRIRDWNNPIMIHESLKKLAHLAQVPEQLLGVVDRPFSPFMKKDKKEGSITLDPDRILEVELLRWMIACKGMEEIEALIQNNIQAEDFRLDVTRALFTYLLNNKEADLLQLVTAIDNPEIENIVVEIVGKKINRDKARMLVIATIRSMLERKWMHAREALTMKIRMHTGDEAEALLLAKQFDELTQLAPQIKE